MKATFSVHVSIYVVDNFEANFYHDQDYYHPFESYMVLITEMGRQELYQFHAVVDLLVHHLKKASRKWCRLQPSENTFVRLFMQK